MAAAFNTAPTYHHNSGQDYIHRHAAHFHCCDMHFSTHFMVRCLQIILHLFCLHSMPSLLCLPSHSHRPLQGTNLLVLPPLLPAHGSTKLLPFLHYGMEGIAACARATLRHSQPRNAALIPPTPAPVPTSLLARLAYNFSNEPAIHHICEHKILPTAAVSHSDHAYSRRLFTTMPFSAPHTTAQHPTSIPTTQARISPDPSLRNLPAAAGACRRAGVASPPHPCLDLLARTTLPCTPVHLAERLPHRCIAHGTDAPYRHCRTGPLVEDYNISGLNAHSFHGCAPRRFIRRWRSGDAQLSATARRSWTPRHLPIAALRATSSFTARPSYCGCLVGYL